MTPIPARVDRRHARRAETVEEIIDVAVDIMGEDGVAGLSLGELARRIGIRTPSLYVYFDKKMAIYDAVYLRGWQQVGELFRQMGSPDQADDPQAFALDLATAFVGWSMRNPVHAQLMHWRPVPGFRPSPEAYGAAEEVLDHSRHLIRELQVAGVLSQDADTDQLLRTFTVLVAGVLTQQLANAPDQPVETGAFTTLLPQLVAMFLAHHAPSP